MLANRLIVAIIIVPIGVAMIAIGGWAFTALVAGMLGIAAWEYWRMFTGKAGFSGWVMILGVALLVISRYLWGFSNSDIILSGLVLLAMALQTVLCERGGKTPATDFSAAVSGLVYLGFIGSYLVSLRNLTGGMWWILLAIPVIGIGDAGAFFIGRKFGRHPLAPVVSPGKTLEGYFGGLVFTILSGLLLGFLWGLRYPEVTPLRGLILGAILGVFAPLGDLGESMLKRQFGMKDSGGIFPGHGGMLDRMDSWIWGGVISYYIISWFFIS